MKFKCQVCAERAVIHITEIDVDGDVSQIHFCYRHAQEYMRETETPGEGDPAETAEPAVLESEPTVNQAACPVCGMTFDHFRQIGRLGCPHDYEFFREDLAPLIKNIHDSLHHVGKVPRRLPADTHRQTDLIKLRQEIQQAIAVEDYERAAQLRDKIEAMERSP